MKKFAFISVMMFFLVTMSVSATNIEDGLLHAKPVSHGYNNLNQLGTTMLVTDGNEETFYMMQPGSPNTTNNDHIWYTFDNVKTITDVKVNITSGGQSIVLILYDIDENTIYRNNAFIGNGETHTIPETQNVKKALLYNNAQSSKAVQEFEVFGYETNYPAPDDLVASIINDIEVSLSWNDVIGYNVIGYNIYRNDLKINSGIISETSYIDSDLLKGEIYTYRVTAVYIDFESRKSMPATIYIPPEEQIPPGEVEGIEIEPEYGGIMLTWDAEPNADYYIIIRDGIEIGTTADTFYLDQDVQIGESYSYEIIAVNAAGQSPPSPPQESDPVPEPEPQVPNRPNLSASSGDQQVTLSWNLMSDVDHYIIIRDGIEIGTTSEHTYLDTGLENGQVYKYKIIAVNDVGQSESNEVSARPRETLYEVQFPASATDTIGTSFSFLGIFNEYVLLGLGIVVAGIIIIFIFWIFQRVKNENSRLRVDKEFYQYYSRLGDKEKINEHFKDRDPREERFLMISRDRQDRLEREIRSSASRAADTTLRYRARVEREQRLGRQGRT